jgi:hypothetical protein
MKLAISQSNYIPWKGYFDIIAAADLFIIYDDAQFTKNDWRNRNIIKTKNGLSWLSIPVGKNINRSIYDVELHHEWQKKHWHLIELHYNSANYFDEISQWLKPLYLNTEYKYLSDANKTFITSICKYLDIKTQINESKNYVLKGGRSKKLVNLCIKTGATSYLSGPAAKNYLDTHLFDEAGIALEWMDYTGYKKYNQLWGKFDHNVSILDLLFNCGTKSKTYIKNS